MTKEEPIDEALQQVKALISMLQDNFFRLVDTSDVLKAEKQIAELEKEVRRFVAKADHNFEKLGVTEEEMRMLEEGATLKDVNEKIAETINLTATLKKQINKLQEKAMEEQGRSVSDIDKEKKKKDKVRTKQEHKNKYKRLGGSEDWKPL